MTAPSRIARHHRRRVLLAGPALCTALVLGGCGVSADSDPATLAAGPAANSVEATSTTAAESQVTEQVTDSPDQGALARAAEATAEVTSMKMAASVSITGQPEGDVTVMSFEGAVDTVAGRAHFNMDLGDLMGMLGQVMGEDVAGSGQMELIVDGDTVYLRSDLLSSFSGGKPWIAITGESMTEGGAFGLGDMVTGTGGPDSFMAMLEAIDAEVETVGREQVRGVDTNHVRAVLDLDAILAEADESMAADLRDSLAEMGATGSLGTLPIDAWIGDDDVVRKVVVEVDLAGLGGVEGLEQGTLVISFELFDLGQPVDITLPDPAEVGTMEGMMSGF